MTQAVEILRHVRQELYIINIMGADVNNSNHDIYYVEPNQFDSHTLRVKYNWGTGEKDQIYHKQLCDHRKEINGW